MQQHHRNKPGTLTENDNAVIPEGGGVPIALAGRIAFDSLTVMEK